MSYGDIDHWMWRLYLDDFGEFCDSIGIPVCPYAELTPDDPLPPSTTLLYGISPKVIEKPPYWPSRLVLQPLKKLEVGVLGYVLGGYICAAWISKFRPCFRQN